MDKKFVFGGEAAVGNAVTSAQMKEIERRADEAGLSYYEMMENAGTGAAEYIAAQGPVTGKSVLVICGKGNNGGDGFVAARRLMSEGAAIRLVLAEGKPITPDAVRNMQRCEEMGIPMIELSEGNAACSLVDGADLIVDAIYGTGFHGALREPVRTLAKRISRSKAAVFALDIPSGLSGDTGEADEDTVRADSTIVFHRFKPAHLDDRCSVYCGQTVCISIGIETVLEDSSR